MPITITIKGSPYKNNSKESNTLLEKSIGALTSLPQGMEDPEIRGGIGQHITEQRHSIQEIIYQGDPMRPISIFKVQRYPI